MQFFCSTALDNVDNTKYHKQILHSAHYQAAFAYAITQVYNNILKTNIITAIYVINIMRDKN